MPVRLAPDAAVRARRRLSLDGSARGLRCVPPMPHPDEGTSQPGAATEPWRRLSKRASLPAMDQATQTSFGFRKVAAGERQRLVNSVFSRVASRYDLMNDLMSGGMHRRWKADMINWLAPSPSARQELIDVAGGTGDIARRFLEAGHPQSQAVICDISAEMLEAGRAKLAPRYGRRLAFVRGNAETLPFPDRSFDVFTIAFGIRNVTEIEAALAEAFRVLKRGGRFMCLEFSAVQTPMLDSLYDAWSFRVIPRLGDWVAGDADAYRYLVESIRKFPDQERFAGMVREAGFERVHYRNLTGGIAALHSGWRI
jgi:demethylmenaquinone methyltransferase/2-methoxy-6-polyprenyl-1,4-benzoquinol methylase